MPLNSNSTLSLVYDASGTNYDLTLGTLDMTGTPPIKFTTTVVTQ